ncbi:hypothetical protein P3T18_000744 [Paraburkholderia sp. GAS199]
MLDAFLQTIGALGVLVSVVAHYGIAVSGRVRPGNSANKSLP